MSSFGGDWLHNIWKAFPDQHLLGRICAAANGEKTDLTLLFEDLAQHVLIARGEQGDVHMPHRSIPPGNSPSHSKKRKLGDGTPRRPETVPKSIPSSSFGPIYGCNDVSVQMPARKKMNITIIQCPSDTKIGAINLENGSNLQTEYGLGAGDIEEAFCLPMPDKQARQSNFILYPKLRALDTFGSPAEPILFVLNESRPSAPSPAWREEDTYVTVAERALNKWLSGYDKKAIKPSEKEFASSRPQAHRKGEKAYHVNAHRGSKEGYLFFLENGVIFGFKKPLAFFPFSAIESISYTSVLQRTFNLVIATRDEDDPVRSKEVEFSMIDQEDFAGIDAYVKRHGLNDASLASERRAKAYNVNKAKKEEANGDASGGMEEDDRSELQKAEQQLQDEEDEQEEDYEVSGGESEGEGEDSEEEEEVYDDEEVEEAEGDDADAEEG